MVNYIIKAVRDSSTYYFTSLRYSGSKRWTPAHCISRPIGIIQGEKNKNKMLAKLRLMFGNEETEITAITLEDFHNE